MSLLGAGYTAPEPKPERDAWYRCTKCPFKTKQRKGLPEVMHRCGAGRTPTMVPLVEDA